MLGSIGFTADGNVWSKYFNNLQCTVQVDFAKEELIYPEINGFVINERQTCNFKANENFVVFECVCRLLDKGYQPEHIELEPKWKVGRGASGGRADIWVRTVNDKGEKTSLLIIECKTAGNEFTGAYKDTMEDGAQLFSYFQQEGETKFLCLYTSDFTNGSVNPDYYLINVQDNDDLLANLNKPKTYRDSKTVKQLFAVWKETYGQDIATRGLFESDMAAYNIGKDKYSIADLKEVDSDAIQKKYNEFATILRQHNVSGHENAFDKLVNLFLAKVVDETNNPEELAFYWKGAAYDDYFRLQDRLQRLYKEGMEKFLGEKVTYIDNAQIESAFKLFKKDPDATRATIQKYFRQLKFFTNNDFAFIDVHNEHLFYQNSAVLKKVVQMLQDIRLKTEEQNQFLGDLFEGFLDSGVKQSEGQFFTPLPIVRFLVSSLPLRNIFNTLKHAPHVIDYACGAGHFLNEYARQIKNLHLVPDERMPEFYAAITGIEKEYRLSKVAKVSAFMYGQDDIRIIYADALAKNDKIQDGTFDILIANPPYSVKGFLETLTEEERANYSLFTKDIDLEKNNAIETFFVERAAKLLAPEGVAAIILPSSILSNNGSIYIRCREIILQKFDIVAVAEMGSGTFGKTGTNTVTLFLRRKQTAPDVAEHYRNRVSAWFNNDFGKDGVFEDSWLLDSYCVTIGIDKAVYTTLLQREPSDEFWQTEMMDEYRKQLLVSTKAKKIMKKRITANYTEEQRKTELKDFVIDSVCTIEQDKLYYFALTTTVKQPVVIVKSPSESKAQKQFLGYEWSGAKGSEGIKYLGVNATNDDNNIEKNKGIQKIHTPLFSPTALDSTDKLNTLIRNNFNSDNIIVQDCLSKFANTVPLVSMIDFSRVTFDKTLRTVLTKTIPISSKYPIMRLGGNDGVCNILIGGTPARNNSAFYNGKYNWVSIAEMDGQTIYDTKEKITEEGIKKSNVKLIPKGTTLLSFKLSIGKTAKAGVDLYTNEAIAGLIPKDKNKILDDYLFYIFNGKMINLENVGNKAFGKSLNSKYLNDFVKIPLPPLSIQNQIVSECEKIDEEYNTSRMSIELYRKKIDDIFDKLEIVKKREMGG